MADTNLDSWSLQLAALGSDHFVEIARGEAPLVHGTLATLDPGTLPNGFYTLRLTAANIAGLTSLTQVQLEVQTSAKPAAVQFTDTDLTVTLDGTTVNLTRAYDSIWAASPATFGPGWRLANRDVSLQTDLAPTGLESFGVYPALRLGTRLYLTLPDGSRAGYTFAPVPVNLPNQPSELTYYYPAWQADSGVVYTLDSAKTLLIRGGNSFYDQATGRPYNPADAFYGPANYTLTAPDSSKLLIGARGVFESISADGHALYITDSGIMAADGSTLRLSYDALGRMSAAQAPSGETIDYTYDAAGHLALVSSSTRGVLYRYGYDAGSGTLSVALRTAGTSQAFLPGQPPQVIPLAADLGDAKQFDAQPTSGTIAAGGEQDYALSLSDAEVRSTNSGTVILSVDIARQASQFIAATPNIPGLIPLTRYVDNDRTVALFEATHGGTYLIRVQGATPADQGAYTLGVSVAGDVNGDGLVNGVDSQLLAAAFGSLAEDGNYNFAADLDANGAVNVADRHLLASNYGFTGDSSNPAFPSYFAAPTGAVWTSSTSGGTGGTSGGTTGGTTGGGSSGAALHPTQPPSPPTVPTPAPMPLAPLTNPGFGITNGTFTVTSPDQAGFGWTERGQVTITPVWRPSKKAGSSTPRSRNRSLFRPASRPCASPSIPPLLGKRPIVRRTPSKPPCSMRARCNHSRRRLPAWRTPTPFSISRATAPSSPARKSPSWAPIKTAACSATMCRA